MSFRNEDERDETLEQRGKRARRGRRLAGEEEEWNGADDEEAEPPRRRAPRARRRRSEVDADEDELASPSNPSAPWLPPARR